MMAGSELRAYPRRSHPRAPRNRNGGQADTVGMLDQEKLDVYAVALHLASTSFDIADSLPKGYGSLADQLRRAATSVPANIAEGCGRQHGRDRERFMAIARGSAAECAALIDLCAMKVQVQEANDAKAYVVRVVQMLTKLCR